MHIMRFLLLIGTVLLLPAGYSTVQAQDGAVENSVAEESTAAVSDKTTADDDKSTAFQERLTLARQINDVRPAANQIDTAIDAIAMNVPLAGRDAFKSNMRNLLNYRTIEKISINAMAETYTAAELKAMVDYYSMPEAISAQKKLEEYQRKVEPEIIRMIDAAVMQMRTGAAQ